MFDFNEWASANLPHARLNGKEWSAPCPWCGKSGKFFVSDQGKFICFSGSCGEKSKKPWRLIAKVSGVSPEQARAEAFRSSVSFRRRVTTPKTLSERLAALRGNRGSEIDTQVRAELPDGFVPIYDAKRRKPWRMPKYMSGRGFSRETMKAFGVGYTNSGAWVERPGKKSLYVGDRLIIPISSGVHRSWTARDLTGKASNKYLNAPSTDNRRLLFGWNHLPEESRDIVIQEGPTDVLMSHQHGMVGAIGLMGKVMNREQLTLMFRKPSSCHIVIMLDPEAAAEAHAIGMQLASRFPNIYIAALKEGSDPGQATKSEAWEAFDDAPRFLGRRTSGLAARLRRLG